MQQGNDAHQDVAQLQGVIVGLKAEVYDLNNHLHKVQVYSQNFMTAVVNALELKPAESGKLTQDDVIQAIHVLKTPPAVNG